MPLSGDKGTRALTLYHVRKTGRGLLSEPDMLGILSKDFQTPEVQDINVCCLSLRLWWLPQAKVIQIDGIRRVLRVRLSHMGFRRENAQPQCIFQQEDFWAVREED